MFKFLKEEIDNREKSAERIAYLENLKKCLVAVNDDPDDAAEVWCMF